MSRNDFIAIILGVSVIAGLIVSDIIFKQPKDTERFRFPSSISRNGEQPGTVALPAKPGSPTTSKAENGSHPTIIYEENQGSGTLSEKELYEISIRAGLTPESKTSEAVALTETEKKDQTQSGATPQGVSPTQPTGTMETPEHDTGETAGTSSVTEESTDIVPAPPPQEAPYTEYAESLEPPSGEAPTIEPEAFFQAGDAIIGELGSAEPQYSPQLSTQEPNEEASTPTMFLPDEAFSNVIQCNPITTKESNMFPTITARNTAYNSTDPALNRFELSIPYSAISSIWSPGTPLVIGVALFREETKEENKTRVFVFAWNSLPNTLHPNSIFSFAALEQREFKETKMRFMIWIGNNQVCNRQAGFRQFSMNITAGQGKIFDIPLGTPTLSTAQQGESNN